MPDIYSRNLASARNREARRGEARRSVTWKTRCGLEEESPVRTSTRSRRHGKRQQSVRDVTSANFHKPLSSLATGYTPSSLVCFFFYLSLCSPGLIQPLPADMTARRGLQSAATGERWRESARRRAPTVDFLRAVLRRHSGERLPSMSPQLLWRSDRLSILGTDGAFSRCGVIQANCQNAVLITAPIHWAAAGRTE